MSPSRHCLSAALHWGAASSNAHSGGEGFGLAVSDAVNLGGRCTEAHIRQLTHCLTRVWGSSALPERPVRVWSETTRLLVGLEALANRNATSPASAPHAWRLWDCAIVEVFAAVTGLAPCLTDGKAEEFWFGFERCARGFAFAERWFTNNFPPPWTSAPGASQVCSVALQALHLHAAFHIMRFDSPKLLQAEAVLQSLVYGEHYKALEAARLATSTMELTAPHEPGVQPELPLARWYLDFVTSSPVTRSRVEKGPGSACDWIDVWIDACERLDRSLAWLVDLGLTTVRQCGGRVGRLSTAYKGHLQALLGLCAEGLQRWRAIRATVHVSRRRNKRFQYSLPPPPDAAFDRFVRKVRRLARRCEGTLPPGFCAVAVAVDAEGPPSPTSSPGECFTRLRRSCGPGQLAASQVLLAAYLQGWEWLEQKCAETEERDQANYDQATYDQSTYDQATEVADAAVAEEALFSSSTEVVTQVKRRSSSAPIELPVDCMNLVAAFVRYKCLRLLGFTSKGWRAVAVTAEVWRRQYECRWGAQPDNPATAVAVAKAAAAVVDKACRGVEMLRRHGSSASFRYDTDESPDDKMIEAKALARQVSGWKHLFDRRRWLGSLTMGRAGRDGCSWAVCRHLGCETILRTQYLFDRHVESHFRLAAKEAEKQLRKAQRFRGAKVPQAGAKKATRGRGGTTNRGAVV